MIAPVAPELHAFLDLTSRNRKKLETLHELLSADGHYGTGASPAEVVYSENKMRLLRFLGPDGRPRSGPPVLFIPAPVSRYFILDLMPGRSFAAHVAEAGFDVFLVDFGEPAAEDRFADLAYYVEGLISRAVKKVLILTGEQKTAIIGYCLGGTLSLLYTARHPERVANLVLLTTLVDGDAEGGIAWMSHRLGLEGESYETPRLVPAAVIKSWFEMLAPGTNSQASRVADLWDRLDLPLQNLKDVRTMATWVDDVVPASGRLLAELSRQFGPGRNALMKGTATVGGQPVDLSDITAPVLSVSAAKDIISPPDAVDAIRELLPHAEVLRLPGGHVGMVAGRSALPLWERTVEFLQRGRGGAGE